MNLEKATKIKVSSALLAASALFFFNINSVNAIFFIRPPVLTSSLENGYASDPISPGVEPNIGTQSAGVLTFKVIYSQSGNLPPTVLNLIVSDGTTTNTYPMTRDFSATDTLLTDGNYVNGEQYVYSGIFTPATYDYHFVSDFGSRLPIVGEWHFSVNADPDCSVNCFSSVLFLPGIEASRLYRKYNNCFSDDCERSLWLPDGSPYVDDLALNLGGEGLADIYTRDIVSNGYAVPIKGNIYKSFIKQMDALQSAGTINEWKAIPYDWRLTPDHILASGKVLDSANNVSYFAATSSPYIIQELRRLAARSKTGKVTIVAHSNGGLVTKRLTEILGPIEAERLIDKIIFVAVPQVGTPQAIGAILHGFDQALPAQLLSIFGITPEKARYLAKNMPMAYNLLPSEAYFAQVDDPVATFTNDPIVAPLRARYGDIIHSQDRLRNFVSDTWRTASTTPDNLEYPSVGNDLLEHNAETLHSDIDNWTPPAGVKFYEIAGWGNETVRTIEYYQGYTGDSAKCHTVTMGVYSTVICDPKPALFYKVNHALDGDGTVVVPSALWAANSSGVGKYWVNLGEYNKFKNFHISRAHADILEVDPLRTFIVDIIKNKSMNNLTAYDFVSTSTPRNDNPETRLHYTLHSPLSLDLYDDAGNHTGISTTTGILEENIPDSHFETFGELKYISVPASTTLHLILRGYAIGTFTLDMEEVLGETIIASTTFSAIPCTASTVVSMDTPLGGGIASSSALRVDINGDGTIVFALMSKLNDIVTFPIVIPDITPPTTVASTTGTVGKNAWYVSDVLVTLFASDTESGIASTTYSLNNGKTWNVYTTPFTINTEGSTTVAYRSIDKSGNREATNTLTLKIDKTTPEALIVFDSITQTLKVIGNDNLSSTTVTTTATSSIIYDQAGHTLQILLTQAKPKTRRINLMITKLLYDGIPTTASASLGYKWSTNIDGTYKMFATTISSSTAIIETHFRPKANVTIIMKTPIDMGDSDMDDDADWRPIKATLSGMVVVGLQTNNGSISASY